MKLKHVKATFIAILSFVCWCSLLLKIFAENLAALSSSAKAYATYFTNILTWSFALLLILVLTYVRKKGRKHLLEITSLILVSGLFSLLALGIVVYRYQDNLIFSPRSISASRMEAIKREFPLAEEFWVTTDDGNLLQGWIVKKDREIAPLAIFFAGQGGEASRYLELAFRLQGFSAAFINYRGYGLSSGMPSDKALFEDAATIYDYLSGREDVDENKIVAIGGSLGTGIATYLASQRNLKGLILFSPYERIAGGVAQDMLPFLPTSFLFKNTFDVRLFASKTETPVLAIIGENDKVILPKRSINLLKYFAGETRVEVIPGDHYSIYEEPYSWDVINEFLSSLN